MKTAALGILFLACAVGANIASARLGMVALPGVGLTVSAGTFAAGLALVLRDATHEAAGGGRRGAAVTYTLVILGSALSWVTAGPALAVASAAAFLVSESADAAVYLTARRRGSAARAVLLSGLVGAPLDSAAFLALAPFPLTLEGFTGQTLVKALLTVLAALLVMRHRR